jgi:hypothetical protein
MFILGTGAVSLAREMLNPPREDPLIKYEEIPESTKSELLSYSPATVFHNAMNSMERFDLALGTIPDFIDVDVIQIEGKIFASHSPYHSLPLIDPILAKLPNVIGPFKPSFEGIASKAAGANQPLYLDLKNLGKGSFKNLQEILREEEIEHFSIFSSKHWDLLDHVKETYGPEKVVYSIGNSKALERFFDRGNHMGNVSLAEHLASEEIVTALKSGGKVFVYTVNKAQDALTVLRNGADGIVTENLSLLAVYGRKL